MEHKLAQRRMIVCAAFFSFGTLCGALILFKLSEASFDRITVLTRDVLISKSTLVIPAAFMLYPLFLILSGVSAIGRAWIAIVVFLAGITSGFLSALSFRCCDAPVLSVAVLLIYSLCLLVISVNMAGISVRIQKILHCGGMVFPDYRYFAARVAYAVSVLLLEAAIITYYFLRL